MNKFVKLSYLNHTMTCDKFNKRTPIHCVYKILPPPKKK